MTQKQVELFIKTLIAGTFLVPLVVIPSSFIFPFIVPKILLFRGLVLVMLAGYITLLVSNYDRYKIRLTPVTGVVLLFFISFAISTFVGVDWYRSFWDNHERMLGLFTIFHYVLYYLMVSAVVREWRDWLWLSRLFALAGSVVILIGLFQVIDPDFLLNRGSRRVSSTLGNPIYVGGYGLFLTYLSAWLISQDTHQKWRYAYILTTIFGILGIFISGTRGTLMGLLVSIGAMLLMYYFTLKKSPKAKRVIGITVISGIAIVGLLLAFRETTFVKQLPGVGRLVNTDITRGGANTRIMAWGIAYESWKEKPIFGWGPNNYYFAYNQYYRPEFLQHGFGETWFDNAHNVVMNTLSVQGIVGLILYIGMFGVPIWYLWKSRDPEDDRMLHSRVLFTGFLVGHFVHNVFVFENPTSYLYFFFILALIENAIRQYKLEEVVSRTKKVSLGAAGASTLVVLLLLFSTNINPAKANQATLKAIQSIHNNSAPIAQYNEASSIPSPHIDDIRNDFGRTVVTALPAYQQNGLADDGKALFDKAFEELEKNRELHPRDIRVHIYQSQLALQGAQLYQRPDLVVRAEQILEDALIYSPKRQQLQFLLANIKLQLNKPDEAIALLNEARENDPVIGEAWWRQAITLNQIGLTDDAIALIKEAQARDDVKFDKQGKQIVSQILALESVTSTAATSTPTSTQE